MDRQQFTLAFAGDMLCAAVELGGDIDAEVAATCPDDVTHAWLEHHTTVDVWCSQEWHDDADCVYSSGDHGWLPDDVNGRPYRYAYMI